MNRGSTLGASPKHRVPKGSYGSRVWCSLFCSMFLAVGCSSEVIFVVGCSSELPGCMLRREEIVNKRN
jgi:hypothetical protein